MRMKHSEGMLWFERMGHHANFVAGLGILCAVLWYLSDIVGSMVPDAFTGIVLTGIFKGVFGFSAALMLGNTLIVAWKMAQKMWK